LFIVSWRYPNIICILSITWFGDTLNLEILNAKRNPLADEDVRAIVDIECHPQVRVWLYGYGNSTFQKELRDYQEFFKKLPKNRKADILIAKFNGRTVGFLGLWKLGVNMHHVASIGVSVHPDYWGQGVATQLIKSAIELARVNGFRRLEIETLLENVPMKRITEQLGFKLESLRKERVNKDGVYHDEVVYSMLL
jgi:ribosomal-protein-alanine N-acetyltransferase